MAYTIGSDKGKKIAEEMKAGDTYKASDGSTWTKKSDGSVSVTHNGKTTNNAYQSAPSITLGFDGSVSSDSNGSYSTPSGGSTPSGNSQYSKGSVDYGTLGQQQMASGASWQDVLATYNARNNKALTTEGLGQYANDAIQQQMWDYISKNMGSGAASDYLSGFTYNEEKPTYNNKYDARIEAMLDKILNREDFSYDAAADPLYQQYASMYKREGDRAMRDTMAEAAASAGGMNSYAITAAQQAQNYYNAQLGDKIPELYQMAYEMYLQDKESQVQDLGLLQSMDATQYNRYRDTMQDYYNDKNFAYGLYADSVSQGNWQKNFDYNQAVNDRNFSYNSSQDAITNNRLDAQWDNTLSQQELDNKKYYETQELEKQRYEQENARELAISILEGGHMPDATTLQTAGISTADANAYLSGVKDNITRSTSTGGDSPKKKVDDNPDDLADILDLGDEGEGEPEAKSTDDEFNGADYAHLGLGPVTEDTYAKIAAKGGFIEDSNGNIQWAKGWNKNNWLEKLQQANPNWAVDHLMQGLYDLNI